MKIALVQMSVAEKDKQINVRHGLDLLNSVDDNTDVAVLPEVWTTGYSLGRLERDAETMDSELLKMISEIAKRKRLNIIAGSIALNIDGKISNTSLVFDKEGKLKDYYSKVHLFSLFNEQSLFAAGNKRTVLDIAGVRSGVAICYDIRFPEFVRAMVKDGAKILYLPAEWPSVRGAAWELMIRANAAISQIYVCAVNCVGSFKGQEFYGHSMLVNPMGEIVAMAGSKEEIVYVQPDMQLVDDVRSHMSVMQDLRSDLYY